MKQPSEKCFDLIKRFESCKLTAYPDPGTGGDPWTIGWGHTGPEVKPDAVIDQRTADAYLVKEVQRAADAVNVAVTLPEPPFTQGMFDAFTSMVYNIGPGGPHRDGIIRLTSGVPSTFLRKLNAGDTLGASLEILKWNKAAGHEMLGLTRRRAAEQSLFLS